uniref:Interleukin 20 receptor subunit alpha n=1 Tax=Catharus ustulatus TaxID=91951 RepID=A0A8C3VA53_CATUS
MGSSFLAVAASGLVSGLLPPEHGRSGWGLKLYCSLPNPRNVRFESINMKNVLHWSAPEGTGDGVFYKVKYAVYGVGKWIRKPECRNINRTWCDLSSETSDYEEQYYASVKAFLNGTCSDWMETTRFNPLTDTKIDPPMVSVSSTDRSISIILTAPEKWKRSPEEESISLLQVYPGLQYNVSVLNKKTKKRWFFSISNNTLVVPWLEPGTAYCVSAQIHVTTPVLDSGFSKEHCITTLKDKTEDEAITITFGCIMPTTLALLFISVACYCVHKYIHVHKQKHPANLVSVFCCRSSLSELCVLQGSKQAWRKLAEDFSPGQKPEEKFCAPRGLQGEPQIALGDLVDMETGQLSSPQQEVRLEKITQDLTEKGVQSILVDLDPHSGRLYIPTLSSVEDQMCEGVFKCDDPNKEGILLRLYEKEVSGESSEDQEMYLLQFKEQWGLHVEMED